MADNLRLRALLLIHQEDELCVCELTAALGESQPKVSRHLAHLRSHGLLLDRRQGQWVFYRLNPALPNWACTTLNNLRHENPLLIKADSAQLKAMGERPARTALCD
ncbi:MAG: metalloregulator ArsR/SmtB family transcription factor [Pontibacterium sp.]